MHHGLRGTSRHGMERAYDWGPRPGSRPAIEQEGWSNARVSQVVTPGGPGPGWVEQEGERGCTATIRPPMRPPPPLLSPTQYRMLQHAPRDVGMISNVAVREHIIPGFRDKARAEMYDECMRVRLVHGSTRLV